MKQFFTVIFAVTMILSAAIVGNATSSNAPISAGGQVKVERKSRHIGRRTYRRGNRIGHNVGHKSKRISTRTYHKTKHGTRKVYHKVKRL